jgi:DNA-binding NtrC family response regulator
VTQAQAHKFPHPNERTPALLIVGDELLMRVIIADYLQECGFKVLEADDAEEAIDILKAGVTSIDLVFSDVTLPGAMDGMGLNQWLCKHMPGMPIILSAGDTKKSEAARELCRNAPFFADPYDVRQVVTYIRGILGEKKRN